MFVVHPAEIPLAAYDKPGSGDRSVTGSRDPLDRDQVGPMAIARYDGVPLAGSVLESAPPSESVRTVLSMASPVLGLDHEEAVGAYTGKALAW